MNRKIKKSLAAVMALTMVASSIPFSMLSVSAAGGSAPDYTLAISVTPEYTIKWNKTRDSKTSKTGVDKWEKVSATGTDAAYSTQVDVYANGSTQKFADKSVKDWKNAELIVSAGSVDYSPEYIKSVTDPTAKKALPKLKWYVTLPEITNPFVAMLSKDAQAEGKAIASCSNGKVSAGKITKTMQQARVWAFDQNGKLGYCDIQSKMAPAAVYGTSSALVYAYDDITNATDFDDKGKLIKKTDGKGEAKLVKTLNIGIGQKELIYYSGASFYAANKKIDGDKSKFIKIDSASTWDIAVAKEAEESYVKIIPGSGDNEGKAFEIQGLGLKDGKVATATVNITNVQSQKKYAIKVTIGNPVVGITASDATMQIDKTKPITKEIKPVFTTSGASAFPAVDATTDKVVIYVSKNNITDFSTILKANGTIDTSKITKPDSTSKFTASWKTDTITAKIDKTGKAGDYYIVVVANTKKKVAADNTVSYPGMKCIKVTVADAVVPLYKFGTIPSEVTIKNGANAIASNATIKSDVDTDLSVTVSAAGKVTFQINSDNPSTLTFATADISSPQTYTLKKDFITVDADVKVTFEAETAAS